MHGLCGGMSSQIDSSATQNLVARLCDTVADQGLKVPDTSHHVIAENGDLKVAGIS